MPYGLVKYALVLTSPTGWNNKTTKTIKQNESREK